MTATVSISGTRASVQQKTAYTIEHRIELPGGRIKWVEERGETRYSTDGKAQRSIGTTQDITESKRHQTLLALQARRAEVLLELPRIAERTNEVGLLQYGLELAEALTESTVSFAHFVVEQGKHRVGRLVDTHPCRLLRDQLRRALPGHQRRNLGRCCANTRTGGVQRLRAPRAQEGTTDRPCSAAATHQRPGRRAGPRGNARWHRQQARRLQRHGRRIAAADRQRSLAPDPARSRHG